MEMYGLLFAIPVTFVASMVFCLAARFVFYVWPPARMICAVAAAIILVAVLVEIALSFSIGPYHLHKRFGLAYTIYHLFGFFLGPPSVGVLVFVGISRLTRFVNLATVVAILLCWVVAWFTVFANIVIDEDVYGIDFAGRDARPSNSIFPP